MNTMYHIYNEGNNVLFRDNNDYIYFINKFACSCVVFQIQVLAITVMSTHFHALIEINDKNTIQDFFAKLKKAYAIYYSAKYGNSVVNSFNVSITEVIGRDSIKNELCYIAKNPTHHYVVNYPLSYPYSSISYLFLDKLLPSTMVDKVQETTLINNLSHRQKEKILGRDQVPDDWSVYENYMICPSSFINTNKVRAFWNNNVKSFIYDMNLNQTDARKELIQKDILDVRASGLSDIEVCKIIDDYAKQADLKSFHQLEMSHKDLLVRYLRRRTVPEEQIKRCLWL